MGGPGGMWETSLPSPRFCCGAKTSFKEINSLFNKEHFEYKFCGGHCDTPHRSFFRTEDLFPSAAESDTEDSPPWADAQELPQLNAESLPQGHVTVLVDTEAQIPGSLISTLDSSEGPSIFRTAAGLRMRLPLRLRGSQAPLCRILHWSQGRS